ncbi:GAF domain-containing protein, partial [Actinoplanes philippinensis]|uniref:GAF domain-containing protein n=1 Tax=Actinoplanes philippinensis TaxID=35752 RepID=UPI003405BC91
APRTPPRRPRGPGGRPPPPPGRSYAGVPLQDGSGHTLGSHCILGTAPRTFTEDDLTVLQQGAGEVMAVLADHRAT